MSTFKPSIKESAVDDEFIATLPANARGFGWDILHDIQDHVVKIDRELGRTQLGVWINEGYPQEEALAILTVAVYTATHNLEDLLATPTFYAHMLNIGQEIKFENCYPSADFVEIYLKAYMTKKVTATVFRALNDIHSGFRLGWFDEHIGNVVLAKRAIEFIPLTSFTITPWEKSARVNHCQNVIDEIEAVKEEAKAINARIAGIKLDSKRFVESFLKVLNEYPFTASDAFAKTTEYLTIAQKESKGLFESLETDYLMEQVEDAVALAPLPPTPSK